MKPREEIKDFAPNLSQWTHSEGYTVPLDYFNNLSQNVIERVEETSKLQTYFQSFPDQVMKKINQEEEGKIMSIRSYFKYGAAAAIFLVVGTLIWSSSAEETKVQTYSMIEIGEELDFIIDEISMEDIFDSEFIDDESLEEILASGEEQFTTDDLAEELLFSLDDDILEEFL